VGGKELRDNSGIINRENYRFLSERYYKEYMNPSWITIGIFETDKFGSFTWYVCRKNRCKITTTINGDFYRFTTSHTKSIDVVHEMTKEQRWNNIENRDENQYLFTRKIARKNGFLDLYKYMNLSYGEQYDAQFIHNTKEGRNLLTFLKDELFNDAPALLTEKPTAYDLLSRECFSDTIERAGENVFQIKPTIMDGFYLFLLQLKDFESYIDWSFMQSENNDLWNLSDLSSFINKHSMKFEVGGSSDIDIEEYIKSYIPESKYCVYTLELKSDETNNLWWYVGMSKSPLNRIKTHINHLRSSGDSINSFRKPEPMSFHKIHSIVPVSGGKEQAKRKERERAFEIARQMNTNNVLGGR
jgi:hypothetical protein